VIAVLKSYWYHLIENLCIVGGSINERLARVKAFFLWQGNVAAAIAEFDGGHILK